ncbi:MAG: hypothetical protein U0903_07810 [Planctomycetales bacterium]
MSQEAFRFLHAGQLRLDHTLQGFGDVPEAVAEILDRGTLRAFERVVDLCAEQRADFLLLTGNTLVAADHTLSGEAALIRGLEKLDAHQIPVFIIPGELDPEHYWDTLDGRLPENTTRISAHDPEACTVSAGDHPLATILPLASASGSQQGNWIDPDYWEEWGDQLASHDAPFPIAMIHQFPIERAIQYGDVPEAMQELLRHARVRYWASGATTSRFQASVRGGLWQSPGGTIGIGARDYGSQGCASVEVDSSGRISSRMLPTSPLRREDVTLELRPQSTRAEIITELLAETERLQRVNTDRLLCPTVEVRGYGTTFDALHDLEYRRKLTQEVYELSLAGELPLWIADWSLADSRQGDDLVPTNSRLGAEFLLQWNLWQQTLAEKGETFLDQVSPPKGIPAEMWNRWREGTSETLVRNSARRWGLNLLCGTGEESHAHH